ncbi:E3 ubiquitin-protein ligase SIAH1-like [Coccinella septempunctata]|uniref:E3 ubiquitin-protein ligase SIAH1-like n=1 Tax=Coccinella septempunctata TaxID=41139 RepID=UPI001D093497|nr:E3 ubiquitin-protein ligase SIAH1-like [Coccinella septempunctata]
MNNPVLSEFECPICMEYMIPPIHQCTMGHTFCVNCFDKFSKCPTCRSPKGVSRAYALERIHSSVIFPCRFRSEGCEVQILGSELSDHQGTCTFAKNLCPFATPMSCRWQGKRKEIVEHCKEVHPNNIQRGNHIILKCPMFDILGGQPAFYFTIIHAYSQQFLFCWHIDTSGIIRWSMFFIGNPKESKRYKFTISIGNPHGKHDQIFMSTGCEQIVEEYELFDDKYCLTSPYESVKKRCNKNGDLHYEIRIVDKTFENLKEERIA